MKRPLRLSASLAATACAAAMLMAPAAHAQLFSDNEARRAILELRQRIDAQKVESDRQAAQLTQRIDELRRATDENAQMRRSLLELQQQIEQLRGEIAGLRGNDEQMARNISEVQRLQRDMAQAIEDRLRRMEPARVTVDGQTFNATPEQQRDFDAALATFRRGEFPQAQAQFTEFIRRNNGSGYVPSALFWLGNARYATRDYQGAIENFRALLQQSPDHPRAAESVLSIANCQIELRDNAGARRTLEDLVRAYPQSEAASAARERLARLR